MQFLNLVSQSVSQKFYGAHNKNKKGRKFWKVRGI